MVVLFLKKQAPNKHWADLICVDLGKGKVKLSQSDSIRSRLDDFATSTLLGEQELKKNTNKDFDELASLNEMIENMSQEQSTSPRFRNPFCTNIPRYALDVFPVGCDVKKCKKLLNKFWELACNRNIDYLELKMCRQLSMRDLLIRLRTTSPSKLSWYKQAKHGDLYPFEMTPYEPRVMHSFCNQANKPEILEPGSTHVAVGFTDLSQFLLAAIYKRPLSREQPLRWIGYEASAFCAAKTAVIVAMLRMSVCSDRIIQVWYSATWTTQTLQSFREAITYLLKRKLHFDDSFSLLLIILSFGNGCLFFEFLQIEIC